MWEGAKASTDQPTPAGAERLVFFIKTAYWTALVIIAAMATASYLLLKEMMAEQQKDQSVLALVEAQRTLSQRLVFLINADGGTLRDRRADLVSEVRETAATFERNHDRLLELLGPVLDKRTAEARALEETLFAYPHHVDFFTAQLGAISHRFAAALETELGLARGERAYRAGAERAELSATVADAALDGYGALRERISGIADARLKRMLSLHRVLFVSTIGVIALVALFIFRPMSQAILKRTHELVDARNSMAFLAVHDGLTGLHNRTFLTDHFDTVLKGAHRRGERLAVLQLDLDRFKQINDSLGHAAGDFVLVATAQRMRESCRASDLCVRLGGDEFVMILNAAGDTHAIEALARRILARVNQPIIFQGATIHPGASAGIAVYPVDADSASDLLVHADLALYAAKKLGGGAFSFFSEELRRELEHRKRLEQDLKRAIAEKSFSVHFQPQVSLRDGSITGVEALVRWFHPERGQISPGEFIPVAEKSGLMAAVGRIVFAKAIAAAAAWHRAGIPFGRLAVNVSGTELRESDFDGFLFDTLAAHGLPPEKLSLEIVESVILDDEKTGIAAKLRHIRSAGVHLELDDFGTGYASLSHVNPQEIDRLKIDRRFVQNIDLNGDNSKIVRAITELARGLGIAIIAEGAETSAELDSLSELGCEAVQGYSVAFPMPEEATREWLSARLAKRPALTLVAGG